MSKYKLFSFVGDISLLLPTIQVEVEAERSMEDSEVVLFLEDLAAIA